MESEAVRRLVAALTDTGYNVKMLTEDSLEFTFGREGKAEITVKPESLEDFHKRIWRDIPIPFRDYTPND